MAFVSKTPPNVIEPIARPPLPLKVLTATTNLDALPAETPVNGVNVPFGLPLPEALNVEDEFRVMPALAQEAARARLAHAAASISRILFGKVVFKV